MLDQDSMRALEWLQYQSALLVFEGPDFKCRLRVFPRGGREWSMDSTDVGELLCCAYEDLYVRPALAESAKEDGV